MYLQNSCFGCKKYCDRSSGFSIFQKDSITENCLVFKIFQITRVDNIFQDADKFLCFECHSLLVQIHLLEQKFANQFHDEEPDKGYGRKKMKNPRIKLKKEETLDAFDFLDNEVLTKGESDESNDDSVAETNDEESRIENEPTSIQKVQKEGKPLKEKKQIKSKDGKQRFLCPLDCQIAFKTEETLSVHVKSHSKPKPYKCSYCGNNFAKKHVLARHERIHTGERPYGCKECEKVFREKWALEKHYHHEHAITFEPGSSFQREDYVPLKPLGRPRKDKPYQCLVCLKQFSMQRLLDNHTSVHSEENPLNVRNAANLTKLMSP